MAAVAAVAVAAAAAAVVVVAAATVAVIAVAVAAAGIAAGDVRPRNTDAARRFAERRQRENDAPRLSTEVPELERLDLEISEHSGETTQHADSTHVRRIVVSSAPAHFEIPCGDPSCDGGGHDLTNQIMRALRVRATTFEGDDVCHGGVGGAGTPCRRVLRFVATATYKHPSA